LASVGAPWQAVLTRRVDHREWPPWARAKYRPYAAVVAISSAVEAELIGHVGLAPERVHLIRSAVSAPDPSGFAAIGRCADPREAEFQHASSPRAYACVRRELDLPADAPLAAVIGQLIPRKGHGVLLDALPSVLERHPRWQVVCFGRGPLERALQR